MASSGAQLAAYLIDHRFCGKSLSPLETAETNAYIESLGDDLVTEIVKFIAKEPPYSASLFEGSYLKVDSTSWWKSGKRLGFSESHIKMAVSLCSVVASSSGSPLLEVASSSGAPLLKIGFNLRVSS